MNRFGHQDIMKFKGEIDHLKTELKAWRSAYSRVNEERHVLKKRLQRQRSSILDSSDEEMSTEVEE